MPIVPIVRFVRLQVIECAESILAAACVAVLTDLETDFTNIKGLEGVQLHRCGASSLNRGLSNRYECRSLSHRMHCMTLSY